MTNFYNEIMDKITVTPDMHQKILKNLPSAVSRRKKILLFSRIARGASLAACIALLLTAVIAFSGITIKTPEPANNLDDTLMQAVNGIEECASLDDLSAKVNFPVTDLNSLPFTPDKTTYLSFWNNLAEIDYTSDLNSITFRKSKENTDNSGDYNEYPTTEIINISGVSVTLKGTGQTVSLAVWQNGDFSYSISVNNGISKQEITTLIENNIAS